MNSAPATSTKSEPLYLFAGGGSGGHLFPALAVARELLRLTPQAKCHFLCSQREVDQRILSQACAETSRITADFPFAYSTKPGFGSRVRTLFQIAFDTIRTCRMLSKKRPSIMVGIGARPIFPAGIAAFLTGTPLILMESNCVPGRAVRFLSRFASTTLTGLPIADGRSSAIRGTVISVGVPVSAAVAELARKPSPQREFPSKLLILGGSQGAGQLNHIAPAAVRQAGLIQQGWTIVHQCGGGKLDPAIEAWGEDRQHVLITPFLDSPADYLQGVSLVISRAGAATIAELCCAGIPSILVPLEHSSEGHQACNAAWASKQKFGEVPAAAGRLSVQQLTATLRRICFTPMTQEQMASNARSEARPNAAVHAAEEILATITAMDARRQPAED